MKLSLKVFLVLIVVVSQSYAQTYTFKVLVNKGNNEVRKSGSWQPVKVGASLSTSDELRLSGDSYLGLVHRSGKPMELKKPGSHKIADLEKLMESKGAGILTKYTDFILSSNEGPKNRLNATGSVTRGTEQIEVYLPTVPSYTVVYGDEVILTWNKESMNGPFTVLFSNPFGDVLKEMKTGSNSVSIDLSDRDFQYEDNILIRISSRTDDKVSPDQLIVKRLSRADKERVKKQLDEIAATTAEETALNSLVRAGFFESQNLLIDAATAYQKAVALAPDVPEYRNYFEAFLVRTGLKTKE